MGDLLRMMLRLLNTLSADELRNNILYLQHFDRTEEGRP
jgi:hypothetical protein